MLELLDNVVFFPKSLDDLDGLFPPGKEYAVYACRASTEVHTKYPFAYVYEAETGKRLFSTTKFFRTVLSTLGVVEVLERSTGIMTYQAYPWCDDLRNLGYRVCSVPHALYSALHNKFRQKDLLLTASREAATDVCTLLRKHFATKERVFKTEVMLFDVEGYDHLGRRHPGGMVVSNSSSDGGSHVFKVLNKDDYRMTSTKLCSPVVRVESYIDNSIPINQIGVVMPNGWIMKYQPSLQLLQTNRDTGQIEYVGSTYSLETKKLSLADKMIGQATALTNAVGKALYMMGYRGVFGCDYLITKNDAYFIELNPRYQASTRVLSMAESCPRELSPHLLHIGAFHAGADLDLNLLSGFVDADAIIELIGPDDAKGYVRIWDPNTVCSRTMCGDTLVEPWVHVGYNLL